MADNAEMLFSPELVFFDWECATPDEVFARLEGELAPRGYIASGWLDAVRTRENAYPTGLAMPAANIAIPHTDPGFVAKPYIAVIKPAAAPASMASGSPRNGWPATAAVADTAQPSVNAPSVVISAMFKIRKLRNRAMATKAYKKPSSRAVCVIISKRMRSFHAAAPGSRPGERGGEFDWISPWWW